MEKCPGFGLVFFGKANYSREVNISPGITDKTIPRGGWVFVGKPRRAKTISPPRNSPGNVGAGTGTGNFGGPVAPMVLWH